MGTPFAITEVAFADESAFCENAEAPGSNTFATRIPCLSFVPTMTQELVDAGGYQNRLDGREGGGAYLPRSASFELECNLVGLLTDPGSSTIASAPWLCTLLEGALGTARTTGSGTTVSGGGSSTTSVDVTSETGFVSGELVSVGARGDGRAEGSIAVVTAVSVGNIEVNPALPGAPANADVVRKVATIYHDENAVTGGELNSFRFRYGKRGTGQQWQLLGCGFTGVTLSYVPRQIPTVRLSGGAAYWTRHAATIPSATALASHYSAPVAGGKLLVWEYGTTTLTPVSAASVSVDLAIDTQPVEAVGPGAGVTPAQYQTIFGWQRTGFMPSVTITVPWSTTWETAFDDSTKVYQILFWSNNTPGRRSGFYMPRAFLRGPRPTVTETNGQTYMTLTFAGSYDTAGSTEIEKSSFRMFLG